MQALGKSALYGTVGGVSGVVNFYAGKVPLVGPYLGGIASDVITSIGNGAITGDVSKAMQDIGQGLFSNIATTGISKLAGGYFGGIGDKITNKITSQLWKTAATSLAVNLGTNLTIELGKDLVDGGKFQLADDIGIASFKAVANTLGDVANDYTSIKMQQRSEQNQQRQSQMQNRTVEPEAVVALTPPTQLSSTVTGPLNGNPGVHVNTVNPIMRVRGPSTRTPLPPPPPIHLDRNMD